jgi:hypothetical protein
VSAGRSDGPLSGAVGHNVACSDWTSLDCGRGLWELWGTRSVLQAGVDERSVSLARAGASFGLGPGHVDFAGSSVAHMVGGVAALANAIVLGPRLGKHDSGEPRFALRTGAP